MPSQLGLKPFAGRAGGQGRYVEIPGATLDVHGSVVIPAATLADAGLDAAGD